MPIPSGPAPGMKRRLLRDDAHDAIRDAILRGDFAPGERIDDHALQEWLGISRTPIRDALKALEMEGLVESSAQSYTRVVIPDPSAVDDSLQTLGVLIGGVTRITTERLDDAALLKLRGVADEAIKAIDARDPRAHLDAVLTLYNELLSRCPNQSLVLLTRATLVPTTFQYRVTIDSRSLQWELLASSWGELTEAFAIGDAVAAELAVEAMHRLPLPDHLLSRFTHAGKA